MIDKEQRADARPTDRAPTKSDQSEPPITSSAACATWIGVAAFAVYLFGHLPRTVLTPVGLFDEGIQLSLPLFIEQGLIPFRDFYIPYGPGNGLLAAFSSLFIGDSILANRVLFIAMQALLAGLATYLVTRRRGALTGIFMGVLTTAFSTASTYVMLYVFLVAGFITLIGWQRDAVPFAAVTSSDRIRQTVVGSLFGIAAWFRFEFGFVLLVWSALVLWKSAETGKVRWPRVFWVPWLVGLAPYLLVVVNGGGDELFHALRYAATDYGSYRGVRVDMTEPFELIGQLIGNEPIGWGPMIVAMSFGASWIGFPLLASGPILKRSGVRTRPFAADGTRMILLIGSVAIFAMYSLSIRGDHGHASQLITPLWLTLLWTPFVWRTAGKVLAVSLAVLSLVAGQAITFDRWQAAADEWREHVSAPFPRAARVPFSGDDAEQLADLLGMWSDLDNPESVFVANRVNDITHVNAVAVYWLLEAKPATWMTTFDPGFADQEEYQTIVAQDLCDEAAPVVLMHTPRSGEHPPERRFSPYLDRYLALNYELVDRNDRFDLRVPRSGPCLFPNEEASFEALEDVRLGSLTVGDIVPAAVVGEWQLELSDAADLRGDRILIAEHVGLWHSTDELTGVHQELLSNWRRARMDPPPPGPLAVAIDPLNPGVTGVSLYINGLLTARDVNAGLEVELTPNEWFLEALKRDPSIGGIELLHRSLERGKPGYLAVAEAAYRGNPHNPGAMEQYGIALFDEKNYVGALDLFESAAQSALGDDAGRMLNHVGSALRALGDLSCSAAVYEAAVEAGFDPAATRMTDVISQGGDPVACMDSNVDELLIAFD